MATIEQSIEVAVPVTTVEGRGSETGVWHGRVEHGDAIR
jgi:hypothetical protein